MSESLSLQVERMIPGPIDEVFDAWLDPDRLRRWMAPGPGMTVSEANTNPVVGGDFRIVMAGHGRSIPHEGKYLEINRPTSLVFTWISEPAGQTTVRVRFERLSERQTKVILTHEQFQTAAARDSHRGGWMQILEALERAA